MTQLSHNVPEPSYYKLSRASKSYKSDIEVNLDDVYITQNYQDEKVGSTIEDFNMMQAFICKDHPPKKDYTQDLNMDDFMNDDYSAGPKSGDSQRSLKEPMGNQERTRNYENHYYQSESFEKKLDCESSFNSEK